MNTSLTEKETHSLDGNEVEDVNSAASGLSAPIMLEEVARQIRAATDTLPKQFEMLCDLLRELCRDTVRRVQVTSAKLKAPSGPHGGNYDTQQRQNALCRFHFQISLYTWSW